MGLDEFKSDSNSDSESMTRKQVFDPQNPSCHECDTVGEKSGPAFYICGSSSCEVISYYPNNHEETIDFGDA